MKTVTIPFDLEMAKKIQNGEVEGEGNYCANCFLQPFAEYGCDFLTDYVVGYCSKLTRTDNNDVIFIEVEETDKQE